MNGSFRDYAGIPDCKCDHCGASLFKDEILKAAQKAHYCCHHGIVPLNVMKISIPRTLRKLLLEQTSESKEFKKNIRRYNNLFAFTSMKANLDHKLASQRQGIYTFRVSGVLHH